MKASYINKTLFWIPAIVLLILNSPVAYSQSSIFPTNGDNVGIGTLSPQYKLTIIGNLNARSGFSTYEADGLFGSAAQPNEFNTPHQRGVIIGYHDNGNATYSPRIGFQQDPYFHAQYTTASKSSLGLEANGDFTFMTGTVNAERLRISAEGNVGVGIASPVDKLEIAGVIRSNSWRPFGGTANDFFVDVEPGTRILRTRNYNLSSPNVASTGIHTGSGYFETNVGIGTSSLTERLSVNGNIRAKEIKVETGWADFVFKPDYKLRSLFEIEQFIKKNGHLPEIPSAAEVEKDGIFLGEMNAKLLQKIEELTLHMIEQAKKLEKQELLINQLLGSSAAK